MVYMTKRPRTNTALWLADDVEAAMVEDKTGEAVFQTAAMANVWVELSASGSTAHGPALRIRLVSEQHPQLAERKQAEGLTSKPVLASAKGMQKHSKGTPCVNIDSSGFHMRSPAGAAWPAAVQAGAAVQATSSVDSKTMHNNAIGRADAQESKKGEGRSAASKQQHRRAANRELGTIAAVLASSFVFDESELSLAGLHLGCNTAIASADVHQDLVHAQASADQQLVSCTALPVVTDRHAVNAANCTGASGVWQAQLRLGKVKAKVDASLTSSDRMNRLQTKLQAYSISGDSLQTGMC